jgi:TRAP-type uncharacterized transport system substrate-binding protein
MNGLRQRLRENIGGRDLGWYVAGIVAALLLLGWLLAKIAPPPPPQRVVMTTGAEDGAYHRYAQRYRALLAEHGIELVLRTSSGAQENLERLRSGAGGVEVGLVQGGLVRDADRENLTTLGSFFYEPIWLFYRGKSPVEHIAELHGQRIAIGLPGSGTHALGLSIMRDNGLAEAPTVLVESGGLAAASALVEGRVDAALFVSAIDGPAVQKLLRSPGVRLMHARRAEAYIRRLPYLHRLDLPEGVIDLKNDVPPEPTTLIALTANMVARPDLHPVAIELLLEAGRDVHGGPSLLHAPGLFPSPRDIELPLDTDAERIYKERPSLLRRLLPFWVAVWAERWLFILLPLLAIALPAFAYLPKIYDWRIRSKLDGWYAEVNRIERAFADGAGDPAAQRARMQDIAVRLNRVRVPNSYLAQLYTLRVHADYVQRLLAPPAG